MSAFRTPEASAPALDQGLVGRPDEGAPGFEAPHSSGARPDSLTQMHTNSITDLLCNVCI